MAGKTAAQAVSRNQSRRAGSGRGAVDSDGRGQRPADHIRLVTAQNDGFLFLEQQILLILGQGDDHLAGDGVRIFSGLV